ncbi:MAG: GvpL/GvpF family gas vesicle protein [Patescibacteria group bacterium]
MIKENIYVYAIISTMLSSVKLEELARSMLGINNRGIILMPCKDFIAVASNTHFINLDRLDKKELAEFISIHEQINNRLIKDCDVVPMRFGMIVESREEVLNVLEKAYLQFKMSLAKVAGKNEFIVEAFWDEKNMLEKIARENTEVRRLQKEAASRGKILGFAYKIKLGKLIFDALESQRKEYIKDVLNFLRSYFSDFAAGKLLNKEILMNYSFLIEKEREPEFESALNQLAKKYSAKSGKDELNFKYIGPMAPYSFVDIKLSVGNFDLIDGARKTLRLGEKVTILEIKDAYYKLAKQYHPDKYEHKKDQAVLEETTKKMKDITAANEILNAYCKYHFSSLSLEKNQSYSLGKIDVENSIVVKE